MSHSTAHESQHSTAVDSESQYSIAEQLIVSQHNTAVDSESQHSTAVDSESQYSTAVDSESQYSIAQQLIVRHSSQFFL